MSSIKSILKSYNVQDIKDDIMYIKHILKIKKIKHKKINMNVSRVELENKLLYLIGIAYKHNLIKPSRGGGLLSFIKDGIKHNVKDVIKGCYIDKHGIMRMPSSMQRKNQNIKENCRRKGFVIAPMSGQMHLKDCQEYKEFMKECS